jgi:hypothetical protein
MSEVRGFRCDRCKETINNGEFAITFVEFSGTITVTTPVPLDTPFEFKHLCGNCRLDHDNFMENRR